MSRPLVETALALDLAALCRAKLLKPGLRTAGTIRWTRDGATSASVAYEADLTGHVGWLRLRFVVGGHEREQLVTLGITEPTYGGCRWWLRCPVTGRRVRVLHLVPGGTAFASRVALGLAYASQRAGAVDRALARSDAARRQIGISDADALVVPRKIRRPRYMRRARFARLLRRLHEAAAALRKHMEARTQDRGRV